MARNKYPEETRNLIIKTAARLFVEKGYEHTSIQDIIDHLGGLSKGAIYYHFKSKEEIMGAVSELLYDGADEKMREISNRADLNGLEKMRLLFRESVSSGAQEAVFAAAPDLLEKPRLLVFYLRESVQKDSPDLLERVIREGIADGSIKTDYPRELAEAIILLGNLWLNPMVYHCDPKQLKHKTALFRDILLGLGLDIISDDMYEKLEKFGAIYQKNGNR